MVCLATCTSCQKEEGLNIVGTTTDQLSKKELTDLVKNCFFRCDPCFSDRIQVMEEAAQEKIAAKNLNSKKQTLVKRSG
ncbi:MAG: hypothetical protein A4S09_06145 [Proteobacteria bacterium SG_bin7]|nr:MAG: hypothetical protein A4S09_06145 [Proteobacteria bacterium SG_bin7]